MDKSTLVFQSGQEGQEKFDYFVTGLTGAVLSYVSQNYSPRRLAWGPESLEPIALIVLGLSFYLGFKRIEASITVKRLNHEMLDAQENAARAVKFLVGGADVGYDPTTGEHVTAETAEGKRQLHLAKAGYVMKMMKAKVASCDGYYRWRNRFLYVGLAAIVLSKLLQPYPVFSIAR